MVMTESHMRGAGFYVDASKLSDEAQRIEPALISLCCLHQGCSEGVHCRDCVKCRIHCRCQPAGKFRLQLEMADFWTEELRRRQEFAAHVAALRKRGERKLLRAQSKRVRAEICE